MYNIFSNNVQSPRFIIWFFYLIPLPPKLSETDEMLCWENDECPVEDQSKYTKAWRLRSAEKNPTMETHFDSEVRTFNLQL